MVFAITSLSHARNIILKVTIQLPIDKYLYWKHLTLITCVFEVLDEQDEVPCCRRDKSGGRHSSVTEHVVGGGAVLLSVFKVL
jgi:hypothetical protein